MTAPLDHAPPGGQQRMTLQQALSRALTRVTVLAVAAAGATVLITGFIVMRGYAQQNLELVARYSSYSVEPALVFNDRTAAMEAIAPIAAAGGVAEMTITRTDGTVLAHWVRPTGKGSALLSKLVFPDAVVAAIGPASHPMGRLTIVGNADSLLRFLLVGAIGALACLVITAYGTRLIARRLRQTMVAPLQAIAEVAHGVREDRNFARRAPGATITEIDDLGQDFNALLDELQDWHGKLNSAHEALVHKANHDPLSGLPNRSAFIERVRAAVKLSSRTGDRFGILFMDGDRFKDTNDRFGHAAGDRVIAVVAERLAPVLRAGDVACRLGGDEFAVLIHHLDDKADAEHVASRIADAMQAPIALTDTDAVQVSMSIGIAIYPDDGNDLDALINHADAQMYQRKQQSRTIS